MTHRVTVGRGHGSLSFFPHNGPFLRWTMRECSNVQRGRSLHKLADTKW